MFQAGTASITPQNKWFGQCSCGLENISHYSSHTQLFKNFLFILNDMIYNVIHKNEHFKEKSNAEQLILVLSPTLFT